MTQGSTLIEHFYTGPTYNLREIFVKRELQGEKLGSQLLTTLSKQLKAEGVQSIWLTTLRSEQISRFYSRHGYAEINDMSMLDKTL